MKCIRISIGNTTPTDDRTMKEFVGSEQAKTPLGKLTIALTEETAWSAKYEFSAHIHGEDQYLLIMHPTFFRGYDNVVVFKAGTENISIRGVEDAVRNYLWELHEKLQPGIAELQLKSNDLAEEVNQIVVKKARRAIICYYFPHVLGFGIEHVPFQSAWRELYAFRREGDEFMYVARAVDNEFIGGITRVFCTNLAWSNMADGVQWNQRRYFFWSELAREFAIRELQIPESGLRDIIDVVATEKSLNVRRQPKVDPYIVEKVTFRITDDDLAVVEFGPDNLPTKAYVAASAHKRVATST